jgi:hypothetical protein
MTLQSDNITYSQICQITQEKEPPVFDLNDFLGEESTIKIPDGENDDKPKRPCMSVWYSEPSLQNGERIKYPWYCHDFRNCPTCHMKRQEELMGRIAYAQSKGIAVAVVKLDDSRSDSILSKLPTTAYLKLPGEDGVGALFFDASYSDDAEQTVGDIYEEGLPLDLDWMNLTNTPENKRISGKLGKKEEEKDEDGDKDNDDVVEITVAAIATSDLSIYKTQSAWDEAVLETGHLNPHTADELADAIHIRMMAFQKSLKERGIEVIEVAHRKRKVKLSLLCWKTYNKLNQSTQPKSTRSPHHTQLSMEESPPKTANP